MADVPLPLDLTPFRAGTIWHYGGGEYAYMVENLYLTDRVQVVDSLAAGGARYAEADIRLVLHRLPSHDDLPPNRTLDAWFQEPCTAVVDGQAWELASYESHPGAGRLAPAAVCKVSLRRVWWKDPVADSTEVPR